jgi:hypothetical protein
MKKLNKCNQKAASRLPSEERCSGTLRFSNDSRRRLSGADEVCGCRCFSGLYRRPFTSLQSSESSSCKESHFAGSLGARLYKFVCESWRVTCVDDWQYDRLARKWEYGTFGTAAVMLSTSCEEVKLSSNCGVVPTVLVSSPIAAVVKRFRAPSVVIGVLREPSVVPRVDTLT